MRGIVLSQVLSSHSKTLLPEVDNGLRVCPQAILLSALLLACRDSLEHLLMEGSREMFKGGPGRILHRVHLDFESRVAELMPQLGIPVALRLANVVLQAIRSPTSQGRDAS